MLLDSFGSLRWLSTLSRECGRLASHGHIFSPVVSFSHEGTEPNPRDVVKIAKEMTTSFYSAIASVTFPFLSDAPAPSENEVLFCLGSKWIASMSTRVEKIAFKLFEELKSMDPLVGEMVMRIPSDDEDNCVSLHRHTKPDDKRVVRETHLDECGGIVVSSAFDDADESLLGFSIHSEGPFSYLTIVYVQGSSSSDKSEEDWKEFASFKIQEIMSVAQMLAIKFA